MIDNIDGTTEVRIIRSDGSWIEGEAIRQLEKASELEGMKTVVGLPDLHPGKGSPVGAVFLTSICFYPFIIGSDAGCGVGLYDTSLKTNKVKRDKWVKRLRGLESPWDGDIVSWLSDHDLPSTDHDPAHGTIGGGNHFAELQVIDQIACESSLDALGIDRSRFLLIVHSGSGGMGEQLLRRHTEQHGAKGLFVKSETADAYLAIHDIALKWAEVSRELIARRFLEQLNSDCSKIFDACHNSLSRKVMDGEDFWLHRKGAASSEEGPIVIPGSRGSLNYLVKPVGDQSRNLWSLAHGAGRKWNRSESSPDSGQSLYQYDEAGNLKQKTDARGRITTYEYDTLNRLTDIHYPDSTQDIAYTYDEGPNGKGRLTACVMPPARPPNLYNTTNRIVHLRSDPIGIRNGSCVPPSRAAPEPPLHRPPIHVYVKSS